MRIVATLLALFLVAPAFAESDVDAQKSLLAFISDVTSFEGMYYSVRDYCAPFAGASIAQRSEASWLKINRQLLSDRDSAIHELIDKLSLDGARAAKIGEWKSGVFLQFHNSDRLYKDISAASDMHIACSKRLGEMVSDSMSFRHISPDSFAFWTRRRKP
jgi:hypothetical protein